MESKRKFHQGLLVSSLLVAMFTFLNGCINTPLPDYYVLTAEPGEVSASKYRDNDLGAENRIANLAIGLGPITIPETVNRPNIVTPKDANQLEVAEYHRWSEPLRENISRVMITNMADRLGVNKLYAYPWLRKEIDNIARIDILQMSGQLREEVYLQVRWQILTGTKPYQLLETQITEYREMVRGVGYSALVAAYSEAYASLTDDIAQAIAELNGAADS